ncbi:hypothetical protein I302_101498 [Kwoniella bestiolae CBS 10118]|uniref:Decapping nuclease n=1 Tax=Kwoniella bestiolae CBS 10118 TaxID=1296100 RepID=A0A1B9GCE0_9TREE|nr:hypothetical protein I302_00181 [Kwoniella bestiolae CBS 10118]OCF28692.1 hypothetical protein I302_00181 [Kwoniella bestiolae CBS 10118]
MSIPSSSSSRTSHFLPLPPLPIRTSPPLYRKPTLITTYSHQPDRSITHDDSSMAYYRPAIIGSDLNYGYDDRVERDESIDEHLDGLCDALRGVEKGERRGGIITWRGMITRIMTAPYEDREGWEMTAIALDGSVYVELHDPPEVRAKRRNQQASWAKQSYMGYSYESFSTVSGEPNQEISEDAPEGWGGDVNTNVQWCNVVRSAIGDIPLCLGGEVDCVKAEPGTPHPGLDQCVELKTNKVIENEKQEFTFHKKLLKHWAQSWLLGIPEIQVGFRDDSGILRSQRAFETEKIPRFIASIPSPHPPWQPQPTLHFLHAVLHLVLTHALPTDPLVSFPKGSIHPENPLPPATIWRFAFIPRRGCEMYNVGELGVDGEGRWGGMLREDYVRWRMGSA